MKIEKISLKEHPVLKNLNVDFCDENGKVQDLIVIAGVNGCGKTNLLEAIYDYFVKTISNMITHNISFNFSGEEKEIFEKIKKIKGQEKALYLYLSYLRDYVIYKSDKNNISNDEIVQLIRKIESPFKVIYMPTEINFSQMNKVNDNFKYEYKLINKIDNQIVRDIPSYLATKLKVMQKNDENLTYKEIKEKISTETNDIFKNLELDIKMIGFTKDEKDLPLFENSYGETFDINKLSSGEKQLFIRALTLKMVDANNAIILIDEPEISLHPKWQQKVIKIYENIGKNNQIIIATHSPHLLSSISNDRIRIMKKTSEGIEMKKYEEFTYGQSLETILEDVMEIGSTITPDVANKFDELHVMIKNEKFEQDDFKIKFKELINVVGHHNEKIMLLNLALNVAKKNKDGNKKCLK